MNGKGSTRRPATVPADTVQARWEATFSHPKMKTCPECQREWGGYLQWCPYCAVKPTA